MNKYVPQHQFEPFIDGYIDDEEKELIETIEANAEHYVSILTPELVTYYQACALHTKELKEKEALTASYTHKAS